MGRGKGRERKREREGEGEKEVGPIQLITKKLNLVVQQCSYCLRWGDWGAFLMCCVVTGGRVQKLLHNPSLWLWKPTIPQRCQHRRGLWHPSAASSCCRVVGLLWSPSLLPPANWLHVLTYCRTYVWDLPPGFLAVVNPMKILVYDLQLSLSPPQDLESNINV